MFKDYLKDQPQPDPAIGEVAAKFAELGDTWLKRYQEIYAPAEASYAAKVRDFATPERQEAAAATAGADVQRAAADARGMAQREAAAMGLTPDSGAYAGIARAGELGTALGVVDAENTARKEVRDTGLALERDMLGLGSQLEGRAANAYGNQANTLMSKFDAETDAWNDRQELRTENIKGWGKAIGTGLGLILSDEDEKEAQKPVPAGSAVEAINEMPVTSWEYKTGNDNQRHVGPMAQDFQEATGKGDGRMIPAQDLLGLTVKAIQELDDRVGQVEAHEPGQPAPEAAGVAAQSPPPARKKSKGLKVNSVEDADSMFGVMAA